MKRDSYWAANCLYIYYLTKIQGKDFKSAVLNSYSHGFSLRKQRYGKKTIIHSVTYVSIDGHSRSEQAPRSSKEWDTKPSARKENASNNNLSQKKKKFINNITGEKFGLFKRETKWYF